jgi:hypothetical protein
MDELLWLPKIERARRFYAERGRGKLLLQIAVAGQELATCQILPEHMAGGWRSYLERQTDAFAGFVSARRWLDDDWLPVFHPWFGAAELAGYLRNRVEFGSETCWTVPEATCLADVQWPLVNEAAPLLTLNLEVLLFCRDAAQGRYLVGPRGTYGPLDLASVLMGSYLFYDLRDDPETARHVFSEAAEAAAWHMQRQLDVVGTCQGGTVDAYLQTWLPGRAAAHVSNDFPCLISPAMYRRFGQAADAAVFARFEGAQMHTHNLGWHQFANFAALPGLSLLDIAEDPNVVPTGSRLPELFELVGELPVCLYMDVRTFREHLAELRLGNALVRLTETVGLAEAEELLALARVG